MNKKLRMTEQIKRNKRLCKILSVILVILMCLSSVFMVCYGTEDRPSTNSWNLFIQKINTEYFHGPNRPNREWSTIRQNCFLRCRTLVEDFNDCIRNSDINNNIVKMLDYSHGHGYDKEASAIGGRWNDFFWEVVNTRNDVMILVGYDDAVPSVDGKRVTTEQYQNQLNVISKYMEKLKSIKTDASNLYDTALSDSRSDNTIGSVLMESGSLVNYLWNALGLAIKDVGVGSGRTNSFLGISTSSTAIKTIADSVSSVTKTFAYAIAVILFGINISTTALQNEILTLRGGIKVFARVIVVKFWIDLAIPICIYALNMVNSLGVQILNNISVNNGTLLSSFNIDSPAGGLAEMILRFVKKIFILLKSILMGFTPMIILIVMGVCIVIVIVKLVARCFELTCLVAISPIFFATLVGEDTKRYFRRFISAFLSTAGYIVYIAIVYAVATQWVASATTPSITSLESFLNAVKSLLPRAIIVIASCRVMVKPPKVLLSLTDGG